MCISAQVWRHRGWRPARHRMSGGLHGPLPNLHQLHRRHLHGRTLARIWLLCRAGVQPSEHLLVRGGGSQQGGTRQGVVASILAGSRDGLSPCNSRTCPSAMRSFGAASCPHTTTLILSPPCVSPVQVAVLVRLCAVGQPAAVAVAAGLAVGATHRHLAGAQLTVSGGDTAAPQQTWRTVATGGCSSGVCVKESDRHTKLDRLQGTSLPRQTHERSLHVTRAITLRFSPCITCHVVMSSPCSPSLHSCIPCAGVEAPVVVTPLALAARLPAWPPARPAPTAPEAPAWMRPGATSAVRREWHATASTSFGRRGRLAAALAAAEATDAADWLAMHAFMPVFSLSSVNKLHQLLELALCQLAAPHCSLQPMTGL